MSMIELDGQIIDNDYAEGVQITEDNYICVYLGSGQQMSFRGDSNMKNNYQTMRRIMDLPIDGAPSGPKVIEPPAETIEAIKTKAYRLSESVFLLEKQDEIRDAASTFGRIYMEVLGVLIGIEKAEEKSVTDLEFDKVLIADLMAQIKRMQKVGHDTIFINHIQSHLTSDQYVICKICGKSAYEIIAQHYQEKEEINEHSD